MSASELIPWINSAGEGGVRNSMQEYPGNGTNGPWEFNFAGPSPGYIDQSHVKAYRYDPSTGQTYSQTLTFVGPNQVTTSDVIPTGQFVVVYRDTPKNAPLVDYTEGSVMDEANLDTSNEQAVYAAAEMIDRFDAVNETVNEVVNAAVNNSNLTVVADNIDSINTVAADVTAINAVSADLAPINTVAPHVADVSSVAEKLSDVSAVAADLTDVNTVAGISTEVKAVGDNADAVEFLGNALTGSPLVIDYGSIADPVSNPASPVGVIGAVYANKDNITTVAGSIANVNTVAENIDAVTMPAISKQTDVDHTTPPTDGQLLQFVAAEGKWKPVTVTIGGGSGDIQVVDKSAVPVSVTGTTSNVTLAVITIPGGTANANSQFRLKVFLSVPNSSTTRIVQVKWGPVAQNQAVLYDSTASRSQFVGEAVVACRNSLTSQVANAGYGTTGGWSDGLSSRYATTYDMTQDQTLTIQVQLGDASATVTLEAYCLEHIK